MKVSILFVAIGKLEQRYLQQRQNHFHEGISSEYRISNVTRVIRKFMLRVLVDIAGPMDEL